MVRLQLMLRSLTVANKSFQLHPSYQVTQRYYSSKDGSDSDKETNKKKIERKKVDNTEAVNKLNILLQQMVDIDTSKTKLNLARPKNRRELRSVPGEKSLKSEPVEKKILSAAKEVAESIGGDTKQTESELLSKLLHSTKSSDENISSLSDIVKGMKIDRETKPEVKSRAQQVRQVLESKKSQQQPKQDTGRAPRPPRRVPSDDNVIVHSEPINIFGGEPFGIFTANFEGAPQTVNETWNKLHERELRLAVTHPSSNYFQEMILWTEQGKVWNFPIDNEQGMEEEQNVYFAEHVFMEKHLEPWCPQKGPVRHFMELVCVGLSKNPYMSVADKKGHIEWYKDYFLDKMQLLKEVGAVPIEDKRHEEIEAK